MKRLVFFVLCINILVFSSCYLTTIGITPSPAAFTTADSPFFHSRNQSIVGMATDGTRVVAVSHQGNIALSEDHGVTWEFVDLGLSHGNIIQFNTVVYGEGFFLAGGNNGQAAWSTDGRNWYVGVIGPMNPKNILSLSIGRLKHQTVFVAGGTDGRLAFAINSPLGPWQQVSFSPFGDLPGGGEAVHSIAHGRIRGRAMFIAVGDTGNIAVMRDFGGRLYGPSAVGTRLTFRGVSFNNDRFVVVGDGGQMRVSADPYNNAWLTIREPIFGLRAFHHIEFAPSVDMFVMAASGSILGFSANGESWTASSFIERFPNGITAIAGTNRRIVLGGADGTILFSN